jgi:homoserine kinase type II
MEDVLQNALQQQQSLREQGLPCPTILTDDGVIFQKSYGGEHFIVMAYCLGSVYPNGSFNENQMFDLWPKTGMMHHLLNKSPHVDRKPLFHHQRKKD